MGLLKQTASATDNCRCRSCPPGCACGCGQASNQSACNCGPHCACSPSCKCNDVVGKQALRN